MRQAWAKFNENFALKKGTNLNLLVLNRTFSDQKGVLSLDRGSDEKAVVESY